jgi:hypothetical protein
VAATVTDSVLYSASDSTTVNLASGGGGSPLTLDANVNGGATKFNWSGGSGTFSVYKNGVGTPISSSCTNVSGTNCSVSVATAPVGTQVYVKDNSGHQSAVVSVH